MNYLRKAFEKLSATKEGRVLVDNFLSLSFLQFASYVIPLITFPYLVRVLGPDGFGLVAFAVAFIQYFAVLSDYGFAFTATRDISINRDNREKISVIFNSVMAIKCLFSAIGFIILSIVIIFVPKFRADWLLYVLTYGIVVGNVLFPVWFFQGVERMRYITALNITAKVIFTFSVFIFVRQRSDIYYVPLFWSAGFIIAGIISLYVVRRKFGIYFAVPDMSQIIRQISEGWHVFTSTVAVSLYTTSNTVILGFFAENAIVGYYSAAEKIVYALVDLLGPFSQTVFPYVGKLAHKSKDEALAFLRKALIILGGSMLSCCALVLVFAGPIVNLLLGAQYRESTAVLRIMSAIPFFIAISNILGTQLMLNFGMKKLYSRLIIMGAVYSVSLAFILSPILKDRGIAICGISTEMFLAAAMYIYLAKRDIFAPGFPFVKSPH